MKTIISHTVAWLSPELRRERGWPMIMRTIVDIAFDIDVHMRVEILSCRIGFVPVIVIQIQK